MLYLSLTGLRKSLNSQTVPFTVVLANAILCAYLYYSNIAHPIAYLFKGFFNNRTYTSLYEDCNTIEEMTEAEEKRLALERAKVELDEISESTKFTKEEFWIYIASQHTD